MFDFGQLRIKTKLMAMLLSVSLGSIAIVSYLSWNRARNIIKTAISNQLVSVRASKAYQIESYFNNLYGHVATLCEDRMVVEAMVEFNTSFKELNFEYIPDNWNQELEEYYKTDFFPELSASVGGQPHFANYRPTTQAGVYVQYYYIAANEAKVGDKALLNDANDGSNYSKIHAKYHELFANLSDRFGYYDVFLIDHKTGNVVYSVSKETDFGSNLFRGAYRKTNLATVVERVLRSPERGAMQLVDFEPYRPSYAAPAAFIAGPIYNGPHVVGILAIQLPVDEINKVLTGDESWKRDGLGDTGETYLVGSDYKMRSISRFLIEDPNGYKKDLKSSGIPDSTIAQIEKFNTSILLQPVKTEAAKQAISGVEGTRIIQDYRNTEVLSSFAPLKISGVDWAIISEMDLAEAYTPVRKLQEFLLISTVLLILAITFIARFVATRFVTPMDHMIEGARQVKNGDFDAEVSVESRDEFGELAESFNETLASIRKQFQIVKNKTRENEALLLNVLPALAVERRQAGDRLAASKFQEITVMVASIDGFDALIENLDPQNGAELLDELIDIVDVLASRFDIERLSLLGDDFVAVSGLSRPRMDHTQRLLEFLIEVEDAIIGFGNLHQGNLRLRAGISSGSVQAGIIGRNKFAYNIWGPVMTISNSLKASAPLASILVSSSVFSRLKESYEFTPHEKVLVADTGDSVKAWKINLSSELGESNSTSLSQAG
jgi:class 3 adenylate cyclase